MSDMYKILFNIVVLLFSFNIYCSAVTKYVTNNLNLRYEANAHSYILTVIPRGTAVTIDEDCDYEMVIKGAERVRMAQFNTAFGRVE